MLEPTNSRHTSPLPQSVFLRICINSLVVIPGEAGQSLRDAVGVDSFQLTKGKGDNNL